MKKPISIRYLLLIPLVGIALTAPPLAAKENTKDTGSKPGYSVDGRTSASVLAAKRSHQVAKEDEIGLSVFSGLFVIAVIGFFSFKLSNKT